MKRFLFIFLCLLLVVSVLAGSVFAFTVSQQTVLSFDDYLSNSYISDGTLVREYSFTPVAFISGYTNTVVSHDQFVSFDNNTGGAISFRYFAPFCDPPSDFDSAYLSSLSGQECFAVPSEFIGSKITLSYKYSILNTSNSSVRLPSPFRFCDSNGSRLSSSITYFFDNSLGSGSSTTGSFDTGLVNQTSLYAGSHSVSCVIPSGAAYVVICPSVLFTLTDGSSANVELSDFALSIAGVVPPVTPSLSINWDPASSFDYYYKEVGSALQVNHPIAEWGTYSYQWYSGSVGSGVPIDGAVYSSFVPSTSILGTSSYYCEVTHTAEGGSSSASTPAAVFNVSLRPSDPPSVSTDNNKSYDYMVGSEPEELVVKATVSDGGTLSYQWYVSDSPDGYAAPIEGATSSTYKPSSDASGTLYYWCEVTNDNGQTTETVKSDVICITVSKPTVDDILFNWGTSGLTMEVGSIHTLHVTVPPGLFDSYTLQWHKIVNTFYMEALTGETSTGFAVPTDSVGVFQYAVTIEGINEDGSTVSCVRRTPKISVVESLGSSSIDEASGISWNWTKEPIRLLEGSKRVLQVNIPSSYQNYYCQWYQVTEAGNISVEDGNYPFYSPPTTQLGFSTYMVLIRFADGSTFTINADVLVVDGENFGSITGGGGESLNTGISTNGYYKPSSKNNLDLVEWCKNAYSSGWGYVMGTYGEVLTEDLLSYKLTQYPDSVAPFEDFIRSNWLNKRAADCVGLIKGYCWFNPDDGSIGYAVNDTPDYSADQMFEWCANNGTIDTLPEVPGLLLWKPGHVGVYIGDGYVIEARGTYYGVIKSRLSDLGWTHWAYIPSLSYLNTIEAEKDNTLGGIWNAIKNIPQAILDGIKGLFVPDAEAMAAYSDQWEDLLARRFGAVYESVQIISDFASSIQESSTQGTISFPLVSVNLAGVPFSFGGWEVKIIPDGFDFLVEVLKKIISILATLAFVNSMRRKFEGILGGGQDG